MPPEQRDQQLSALLTIADERSAQTESLIGLAGGDTERLANIDARIEALLQRSVER